jgi:hypothetical protein
MSLVQELTFVVAVNNRHIFEQNFLASPCLRSDQNYQVLVQEGFPSAARAYNEALDRSATDLLVFVHQDVYLPEYWLTEIRSALEYLEKTDPQWGVLGCWGVEQAGKRHGYIYSTGWGLLGRTAERPAPVQTLDEIVLILRKSSGLRFNDRLPHFHFYGADICLTAAQRGLNNYACSAFCIHNTQQILWFPEEFYECYRYIKQAWKDYLPIQTSCIRISRFDEQMWVQKFKECCWQTFGDHRKPVPRVGNPRQILAELGSTKINEPGCMLASL